MADVKMVNLTIEGRAVSVADGTSILEAAKTAGVLIPHYCYHPGLPVAGVCRMCLVEVEKAPKLAPSCATQAMEGQVVHVHSPKALEARKEPTADSLRASLLKKLIRRPLWLAGTAAGAAASSTVNFSERPPRLSVTSPAARARRSPAGAAGARAATCQVPRQSREGDDEQHGHRLVEDDAVVVQVGAHAGAERRGRLRDSQVVERLQRQRQGRQARVRARRVDHGHARLAPEAPQRKARGVERSADAARGVGRDFDGIMA